LCTMTPLETRAGPAVDRTQLREALRGAVSALKENGPRFTLAGSYALWAYGAPEPSHDVDLVVAEADVADAVATLAVHAPRASQRNYMFIRGALPPSCASPVKSTRPMRARYPWRYNIFRG